MSENNSENFNEDYEEVIKIDDHMVEIEYNKKADNNDNNNNDDDNDSNDAYDDEKDSDVGGIVYGDDKESASKSTLKKILIFIILFLLIFGIAATFIYFNNKRNSTPPSKAKTTTSQTAAQGVKNPIDFDMLLAGNDEIYSWLKIDDTKVDYPIVQSQTDDSFYMKHKAEDKSWSASGAVFTELANGKGFNDYVTLIYGHNGYSDTMFTTLHYFEKKEFFDAHPYFYIYTPTRKLTYQVVSAFKYDDRHILNSFDLNTGADLEEFQKIIQNPESDVKNVREKLDTTIDKNSKIVVLSTCVTNQKNKRYLVCGVLVNDEEAN